MFEDTQCIKRTWYCWLPTVINIHVHLLPSNHHSHGSMTMYSLAVASFNLYLAPRLFLITREELGLVGRAWEQS